MDMDTTARADSARWERAPIGIAVVMEGLMALFKEDGLEISLQMDRPATFLCDTKYGGFVMGLGSVLLSKNQRLLADTARGICEREIRRLKREAGGAGRVRRYTGKRIRKIQCHTT